MRIRKALWIAGLVAAVLLAVLIMVNRLTFDWPRSPDQVVFQLDEKGGGPMPPSYGALAVPDVTVFGDGTVIVNQGSIDRPVFHVGRLSEQELDAFLRRTARSMNGLKTEYRAEAFDAGTTTFSLVATSGLRQTEVYCLSCFTGKAFQKRLSAVKQAGTSLLPPDAPLYVPDTVDVVMQPVQPNAPATVPAWPEVLPPPVINRDGYGVAEVKGAAVESLLRNPGRAFRFGDGYYSLIAVPRIAVVQTR